jgi:membrane protease YdiL (CAAX protease family)
MSDPMTDDALAAETRRYAALRVRPNTWIGIVVFVLYAGLVIGFWAAFGVDYDRVSDTRTNVMEAVVIPIGAGALLLAIAATVLGWWRPALFEPRRVGHGWMYLTPVAMVAVGVVNLGAADWERVDGSFVLTLAVGTLLVGFSEEMLTRGLAIVGFRGSVPERHVWLFSCLMFGVLHSINAFFGQGVGATVQQMVFAFAAGIAFYITRRITGTIIVTMLIHAFWDFSTFTVDHTGEDASPLGSPLLFLAVVVAVIALVRILKTGNVVDPDALADA